MEKPAATQDDAMRFFIGPQHHDPHHAWVIGQRSDEL